MLARPAPAKVNLGLHVLRRRADGYHDLATVFVPLSWSDHLAAEPAAALGLACSDPALPTDAGNLVWRAAAALARHAGIAPAASLSLTKRVPYGAGLGSGSSDAAAALQLLADLWDLAVPGTEMQALALALGSDVPFFLDPRPALGTGRGERLEPLRNANGSAWTCPFSLVVAVPPVQVSTAEAFAGIAPCERGRADLAAAVVSDDLERWDRDLTNDFQPTVEARHPAIRAAREALRAHGAGFAALSGTGSAVVGAFEDPAAAGSAARALAGNGLRTHVEPTARG